MSVETNPHNYTNMNLIFSQFVAADFFKTESRSPRGFLPRPLLRAGESVAPPPYPQKNSGGAHHFRFRFLDLCIRFGKIISKVCEGFNSGAIVHEQMPKLPFVQYSSAFYAVLTLSIPIAKQDSHFLSLRITHSAQ